ncbi:DNA repair protein RecO [Patescibacteria group bacterium]
MRNQKLKGIIIKKKSLGEKDYAVTILTPDLGKICATAKGAREIKSKFTGHLDLLNVCDLEIYASEHYKIITECQIQKNYSKFREDLKKFYFASLISKIANKYTSENENSEEIYELVLTTLSSIENFNKEELIYEAFKIKVSKILGILPNIQEIENIELTHLKTNIKEIIYYMHSEKYENISKLKLNKEDLENLKITTQQILEHTF